MKSPSAGALSPEYVLLGLLDRGPSHGYELHQKLASDLSEIWHLSQSQIYSILNRLEEQGYIRGVVIEQEKLPSKRSYKVTNAGQVHFEKWLFAPSRASVRAIRIEFTTRLYFSLARDPQLAVQLVSDQISETQGSLAKLSEVQSLLPEDQSFNRLGLDLRIRQLESILEWLETCLGMVSSGELV
jgi:DNA-binding PadR family transcriptional regulator